MGIKRAQLIKKGELIYILNTPKYLFEYGEWPQVGHVIGYKWVSGADPGHSFTITAVTNHVPACKAGLCSECPVKPQCDTWDDPALWQKDNVRFADYLGDSQEKQELL